MINRKSKEELIKTEATEVYCRSNIVGIKDSDGWATEADTIHHEAIQTVSLNAQVC